MSNPSTPSPSIKRLRVALIAAPLATPIVAPFGTVTTRHNLLVRVETDDGCWGTGEAWGNFPPWGCRDRVDILTNVVRPLLVGQVLDDPRASFARRQRDQALANQLGAPRSVPAGPGRGDIALWDAWRGAPGNLFAITYAALPHRRVLPSMRRTCRSSGRPHRGDGDVRDTPASNFASPATRHWCCGPLAKRARSRAAGR